MKKLLFISVLIATLAIMVGCRSKEIKSQYPLINANQQSASIYEIYRINDTCYLAVPGMSNREGQVKLMQITNNSSSSIKETSGSDIEPETILDIE